MKIRPRRPDFPSVGRYGACCSEAAAEYGKRLFYAVVKPTMSYGCEPHSVRSGAPFALGVCTANFAAQVKGYGGLADCLSPSAFEAQMEHHPTCHFG